MHRRLLVLLAACIFAVAVPGVAWAAKPAKSKATCSLKKKAKCKKAKLTGVKVGKQNLSGTNLKGATISGATFTGTNLSGVDLSGARLTDVTFKNVNLSGATLAGARLKGVTFRGASAASPPARTRDVLMCRAVNRDGGVYTILTGCTSPSIDFSRTSFTKAVFYESTFENANFQDASFTDSGFVDGSLVGANFTGATFVSENNEDFQDVTMTGSMFDDSVGARFYSQDGGSTHGGRLVGASFLNAKGTNFDPELSAAAGVRGLSGAVSVVVQPGLGSPPYTSISIVGAWSGSHYAVSSECTSKAGSSGKCRRTVAKGDTVTTTLVTPGAVVVTASGLTCTSSALASKYQTTCTGIATQDVTVSYAVISYAVTVNSVLQNGSPTPMSKIRFESVAADGTRTILTSCILKSTCSTSVAVGTVVRVSVFREHSNGYFGMNCPGETGDAFASTKTEWPWGDDRASGDPGDTTMYSLRRICDAFAVTGDVTLTAVNDSPDGAPSG
jgi:uncharacterized protein YjbI with pentapeptide repeats